MMMASGRMAPNVFSVSTSDSPFDTLDPDAVRGLILEGPAGLEEYPRNVKLGDKGEIHMDGLKRMIEAQRAVGAITGEVDYNKIIDTRFLPDDLHGLTDDDRA